MMGGEAIAIMNLQSRLIMNLNIGIDHETCEGGMTLLTPTL